MALCWSGRLADDQLCLEDDPGRAVAALILGLAAADDRQLRLVLQVDHRRSTVRVEQQCSVDLMGGKMRRDPSALIISLRGDQNEREVVHRETEPYAPEPVSGVFTATRAVAARSATHLTDLALGCR